MFNLQTIDPAKSYTTGQLRKLSGNSQQAIRRWLADNGVRPAANFSLVPHYSGAEILAAFAVSGIEAVTVPDQRAALTSMRFTPKIAAG